MRKEGRGGKKGEEERRERRKAQSTTLSKKGSKKDGDTKSDIQMKKPTEKTEKKLRSSVLREQNKVVPV